VYRTIDTHIWTDPKIKHLRPHGKLLWVYLITNDHSHASGLYNLPLHYVSYEVGLDIAVVEAELDAMIKLGMVEYDRATEMIWIRRMFNHQGHSEKFRKGMANYLKKLHPNPLTERLATTHGLQVPSPATAGKGICGDEIPSPYGMGTVSEVENTVPKSASSLQLAANSSIPPVASGNGAKSATPKRTRKKPDKPGWTSEAIDDWITRFGGCTCQGAIGKHLKPLIDKHGWEKVRPVWREYLNQDDDAKFLSPAHFAGKYLHWAGKSPKPESKIRDLSNYDPAEASKKAREDYERRCGKAAKP